MEGFVTNLDIFMFVKTSNSISQPNVLLDTLLTKVPNLSEEEQKKFKQFCQTYMCHLQKKWKFCNRTTHTFIKKYETWLEEDIIWPDFIQSSTVIPVEETTIYSVVNEGASTSRLTSTCTFGTSTSMPSPRKPFADLSPMQKKRRTVSLLTHDTEELAYATAKSCGNKDLEDIVKYLTEHPEKTSEIKKIIKGKTTTPKYSPEKALGILISLKLSKWQYTTLRICANQDGVDLYPSYEKVLEAKKACYPPKDMISITELGANVRLQAILDITVSRLTHIFDVHQLTGKSLTLISKCGFDGASGQSNYKQNLAGDADDSSIFMCSFVPLRLICDEDVIWQNPKPSSTLFCRPIYFKFVNENKLDIKEEMAMIEAEITALEPSVIRNNINVKHSLLMTMIDGKITSHLSQTSMQTCDICKAVPSEMNDLKKIQERTISSDIYKYGLSTLHGWIRCMECILHIAYRLDFKKWQARDEATKAMMKNRKLSIQQKFRDQNMGLLIDVVKQGAGTTNDGNTARTFFRNPGKTADITGLSPELIQKFAVILRVVSSGQPINTDTFADFAQETARLYVELYGWYYMPASVHKLLLHGAEIIKHFSILPIGQLSEEASEARNKDFRKIREHHTRKFNRLVTNEDNFNGFIISSDPYLSSIRPVLNKNNKRQVTDEVRLLLLSDSRLDKENIEFVDVANIMDSDFSDNDED